MLFTDIEGSTALLTRLGERYGEALSAQRALMRDAIASWHGHEIGTAELAAGRALTQHEAVILLLSPSPAGSTSG